MCTVQAVLTGTALGTLRRDGRRMKVSHGGGKNEPLEAQDGQERR